MKLKITHLGLIIAGVFFIGNTQAAPRYQTHYVTINKTATHHHKAAVVRGRNTAVKAAAASKHL